MTPYEPSKRKKYYTLVFGNFAELGLSGCECSDSPRLWREAHKELKDKYLVNQLTQQFQLVLWNLYFE